MRSSLSHILQIGAIDTAIVYDGARCMKTDCSEVLGFEMDRTDVAEIMNFCWDFDLEIQITGDEIVRCRETDAETLDFCRSTGLDYSIINGPCFPGKVFRVAFWGSPERIKTAELEIETKFPGRFSIVQGGDFFLDVLPKGVSKGASLRALIERGHIAEPTFVAAAGDHFNDFELLRTADFAAVPCDGAPELLKIADMVIPSAKEHGMKFLADFLIGRGGK